MWFENYKKIKLETTYQMWVKWRMLILLLLTSHILAQTLSWNKRRRTEQVSRLICIKMFNAICHRCQIFVNWRRREIAENLGIRKRMVFFFLARWGDTTFGINSKWVKKAKSLARDFLIGERRTSRT